MANDLRISRGTVVKYKDFSATVEYVIDLEKVVISFADKSEFETVKISDLETSDSFEQVSRVPEIKDIPDPAWSEAQKRFDMIRPMYKFSNRRQVEDYAQSIGVSTSSLYGWKRIYDKTESISALAPLKSSGGKGKSRLSQNQDSVIEEAIEKIYLSKQKSTATFVINEVLRVCRINDIDPPHPNTVRKRIQKISQRVSAKRRGEIAKSRSLRPIVGEFPHADYPLAVVQIDHTKLDIMVVDSAFRKPIGRPWITLATDVFSRVVTGFCISLDPPSALSTGLCLSQSILQKDNWLVEHGISSSWPIWGFPSVVHLDNAKEFRGKMLRRACEEHGINIEWRPVGRPNFGGHVERLLSTLSMELHNLPGSTFSNPKKKGEYKSEENAALTLPELNKWITTYFLDYYHNKLHSAITETPLEKFNRGIFGDGETPGSGLPAIPVDEQKIKLDFLPYKERSIQPYGVVIEKIHYWSDVLRPWIKAKEPDNSKKNRKFIFKYDPRDISVVYFWDPDLEEYFTVPYRDTSRSPMSYWELKETQKYLEDRGIQSVDEAKLFSTRASLDRIVEESSEKTKSARRSLERAPKKKKKETVHSNETAEFSSEIQGLDEDDITPFEDIDF